MLSAFVPQQCLWWEMDKSDLQKSALAYAPFSAAYPDRQGEERRPGVCPACCLIERPRTSIGKIELRIAAIGIRLKDAVIIGPVHLRMFAGAVPEHRPR